MRTTRLLSGALTAITLGLCFLAASRTAYVASGFGRTDAQPRAIPIDDNDIAGVVTDARGPAAGVWVIAETTDLPTKFARIVVTDDQGRYLIPDLPKASYSVWTRGYGLVDSPRTQAQPGTHVNLTSVPATSARAASSSDVASPVAMPTFSWYFAFHFTRSVAMRRWPSGMFANVISQTGNTCRRWLPRIAQYSSRPSMNRSTTTGTGTVITISSLICCGISLQERDPNRHRFYTSGLAFGSKRKDS